MKLFTTKRRSLKIILVVLLLEILKRFDFVFCMGAQCIMQLQANTAKHFTTFEAVRTVRSCLSSFHAASECSELLWWSADLADDCAGNCWHTNRKFPRVVVWVWWLYRLDIRILRHQRDEQPSCSDIVNRMRGNTAEFWAPEETRSRLSKILGSPGLAEVFPSWNVFQ